MRFSSLGSSPARRPAWTTLSPLDATDQKARPMFPHYRGLSHDESTTHTLTQRLTDDAIRREKLKTSEAKSSYALPLGRLVPSDVDDARDLVISRGQ